MEESEVASVYSHYFRLARLASAVVPPEFGTAILTSLQQRLAQDLANLCSTDWQEQARDRDVIGRVLNGIFDADRANDEVHRWLFTNVPATLKRMTQERAVHAWTVENWSPPAPG